MYWESFGFKEAPFALTPNPSFLFLSSPHQEAFAHLLFAIESRAGFIELSGEVGTGKTTMVRTLLNQLDPETYRTALIFNPTLSPLGLLQEVNSEFGLNCDSCDMRELHTTLNAYLLEENRAGRTVVLVIDEAQNLSVEVLEQVRLISNLETDSDKLIQIVLVGQPELNALLSREELRQLDQRITVRYHLRPMGFDDTCAYVRHRIRFAANGQEPLTFSLGALRRIFKFSGGLPRLINGVCDRALLLAYTKERKEVSTEMAALAIADLRKSLPRRRRAVPMKALSAGVALCILAVAGFSVLSGSLLPTEPATLETTPALSREAALAGLAAAPEQQNLLASMNAVLAAWQAPAAQATPGQPATLRGLARQRGMTATKVSGNLDALARLDAPALLHVAVPGGGERLVALLSIDRDSVGVAPAIAGKNRLTRAELAQIWSGGATVLWKDFHGISSRGKAADKAAGVKLLQELLKQVGCYDGAVNGVFSVQTQGGVAEFQRREQLTADGKLGGQTLMMLYRRAGGFFPPGLQTLTHNQGRI
ncbi:Peptidoglycan-binding domain 1 protein [Citrifermentans bremense]|uniref:Peptidoglycan-binding domain 1 protein n=1 Tax=Citrifermentans bremense TaxID=60035 RepID=A0A6S6M1C8_9BACT|nr:AAA family ATPase [Citrifermentans bremense]BCG48147.1 Peptidoglycan-binding domain 1 protein [Citrifermentans bremense]